MEAIPCHTLRTAVQATACLFEVGLPLLNSFRHLVRLLFRLQFHTDFGFLKVSQLIHLLIPFAKPFLLHIS